MQISLPLSEHKAWRERWFPNGEWVLALVLLFEIAIFSAIGENFFTSENFFEVVRLSVELGLLSLAMTPIVITGGIDLSVGSMMALAAVIFGAAWHDARLPIPVAASLALVTGCLGGALNAALITRLNIPPLIVTLGSFSLFRGIAEGMTHASVNYSGFPASFLWLGQGYLGGIVPVQLPIFLIALAAYAVMLHRSAIGRTLYAIGFSPRGARYARVSVQGRLALLYFLSGLVASIAAIIYVAHLGQAKSDAGSGYALAAITAVVLGGTSVFGGRGTVWGTLFGLFSISILQNGLRLAALPSEMSGVLTGTVLIATIALGRLRGRAKTEAALPDKSLDEADIMKNSQLAVLCGAVLAGSLIVAATNVWLVHSFKSTADSAAAGTPTAGHRPTIAVMPKAKGDP